VLQDAHPVPRTGFAVPAGSWPSLLVAGLFALAVSRRFRHDPAMLREVVSGERFTL
jgi:hypothetical protein